MGSQNMKKTDFQWFRNMTLCCVIMIFQIFEKQNTDLSKNKYYYVLNPSDSIFSKLNRIIFVPRKLIFNYCERTDKSVTCIIRLT